MDRSDLVQELRQTLTQGGFFVSEWGQLKPIGFDLVARRDDDLLIIKVLRNVDSFDDRVADELKVLARFLDGSPLLVGQRSSSHRLEDGVVYARQGIPAVNPETMRDLVLEGVPPMAYSAPGGYYVNIDGDVLERARRERGLSLGDLAEVARSSRRTISMYEEGMSAMVDAALRLEEFLEVELVEPIDITEMAEEDEAARQLDLADLEAFERSIAQRLLGVGLDVVPTTRSPFQALTLDEGRTILTGMSDRDRKLGLKAKLLANLSEITESGGVFFVSRSRHAILEGTPLVTREELDETDSREALVEMIREREKQAEESEGS